MVKVIKQPRRAFWRYEETYEFDIPSASDELIERIVSFYSRRRICNLVRDQTTIRFSRGSTLGSLFSPIEHHHKQEVFVTVTERDGTATVVCRHLCWHPYPNLHAASRALQREVR
jgi:hypothetical protein